MSTTTGPLGMPTGRDATPGQLPTSPGVAPASTMAYAGFGRRLLAVILSILAVGHDPRYSSSRMHKPWNLLRDAYDQGVLV